MTKRLIDAAEAMMLVAGAPRAYADDMQAALDEAREPVTVTPDQGVRTMRIEQVTYEMAEPASKLDVLIWLITWGSRGRLFVSKTKNYNKFYSEPDPRTVNCRCVTSPVVSQLPPYH